MIKRTIYLGNPAYLSTRNDQMLIKMGDVEKSIPIEDLGLVIMDNQQITTTLALTCKLLENNVALVSCNDKHHPTGMLFNLDGNTLQSQKFKDQIAATQPLKKQLWSQTVSQKIANQAAVLAEIKQENKYLITLAANIKSGDSGNGEAKAAVYYWKRIFPPHFQFTRERYGDPPNNLLNYGYAILRAITARSLVGSGLLPTLGIFHRNQYNAYCLADDIMEPYRPFVDRIVHQVVMENEDCLDMVDDVKKKLLMIPQLDVTIEGKRSPLQNAMIKTTASLAKCFEGTQRKIIYPVL